MPGVAGTDARDAAVGSRERLGLQPGAVRGHHRHEVRRNLPLGGDRTRVDAAQLGERAGLVTERLRDQAARELARAARHLVARGFEREGAFDHRPDAVELSARAQHEHILRTRRDLGGHVTTRLEAEPRPVEQVARIRTERIARPFRDPGEQQAFGFVPERIRQPCLPVGEDIARHRGVSPAARLPNDRAHAFEVLDRNRQVEAACVVAYRAVVRRGVRVDRLSVGVREDAREEVRPQRVRDHTRLVREHERQARNEVVQPDVVTDDGREHIRAQRAIAARDRGQRRETAPAGRVQRIQHLLAPRTPAPRSVRMSSRG